jgi:ribosomal protein S12 methylthiotransferase
MTSTSYTVGFISLGCPKNQVDCEIMLARASGAGLRVVSRLEDADAVVINTCSFIQPAIDEAEHEIREALRHKRRGRVRVVAVAGCLPQHLKEQGPARFPEVDAWLTPDQPREIADVLLELLEDRAGSRGSPTRGMTGAIDRSTGGTESAAPNIVPATAPLPTFLNSAADGRTLSTPPSLAYLRIADGCNHRCKFCIIPRLRGKYRSRPVADVVAEAQALLQHGVHELALVSQDCSYYGRDTGSSLAELLAALCALPGEFWLRVMYLYPSYVTDELLAAWAALGPKLLPYFDIPLQHVSAPVLKAMGRGGSHAEVDALLARVRAACPEAVLRTSIIVGYPGESEADYAELRAWVASGAVDRLGVFCYSELSQMASAALPGKVPGDVAVARRRELLEIAEGLAHQRHLALAGQTVPVLLDSVARDPRGRGWLGRGRRWQDAYEIDGAVEVAARDRLAPGRLYDVEIRQAQGWDLAAAWRAAGG